MNEIIVEELEIPVPLGDPFILLHNGTYYTSGAQNQRSAHESFLFKASPLYFHVFKLSEI